MHTMQNLIIGPIVTEKATLQKEDTNTIVFKVAKHANKIQVKEAIEKLFKVKVLDVRSVNVRGKTKRVGRNFGKLSNFKKAYVTLSKDSKISFFEGV